MVEQPVKNVPFWYITKSKFIIGNSKIRYKSNEIFDTFMILVVPTSKTKCDLFLAAIAALYVTLSVGWLVGWSVFPSATSFKVDNKCVSDT